MKSLLAAGYTKHPDGTFRKRVEFADSHKSKAGENSHVETIVRNRNGRLLRVIRSARVRKSGAYADKPA